MESETQTLDRLLLCQETNDEFVRRLMLAVVRLTGAANKVPSSTGTLDDFVFYATTQMGFAESSAQATKKLSDIIRAVCEYVRLDSTANIPDDVSDSAVYDMVVELIDGLLESADELMDSMEGRQAKVISNNASLSLAIDKDRLMQSGSLDIPKPQLKFLAEIDNSRENPFRPKLRSKPHALVPLNLQDMRACLDFDDDDGDLIRPSVYHPHPYEAELQRLKYTPAQLVNMTDSNPVYPPADQPFQFIDEEDDLLRAVDEMSGYKEVAIDLEHHSHRSFLGITCLMQISTRDKDYIIDTLALRSKMSVLLTITADPAIVKVFHGCDRDIMWLQRDFGLYVVNCFDTYFAAKVLNYPALSLAHLVKVVCGVTLDKKYQLADWRQRPLPEEMLFYAKNDTHYLLYIYDCLRKEICRYKGTQFVAAVFDSSKNMCLQRFDKDPFNPRGYMKLIPSSKRTKELSFTEIQENMLAVLWDYRDSIARSIDESVTYVMSNAEMIRIARACPKDVSALLSSGPLSEFTRSHAEEVLAKIWRRDNAAPVSLKPVSTPIAKVPGLSIDRKSRGQESDVRLEVDSPFFSELAVEREVSSAPNWGQMGRVDGYSTVSSFNPSCHMSPSSSSSRANKMQSPVPNVEEIYRLAGWNTPTPFDVHMARNETDLSLADRLSVPLSTDASARLSASRRDIQNFVAPFDLKFSSSSAFSAPSKVVQKGEVQSMPIADEREDMTNADHKVVSLSEDVEVTAAVPKSLSEIYEISNRNRKRNKERKRQRDGTASQTSSLDEKEFAKIKEACVIPSKETRGDSIESRDSDFDETSYFSMIQADKAGLSTESTLDFAEEIGWVNAEEKRTVYENHIQDLELAAQMSQEGSDGQQPNPVRKSFESAGSASSHGNKARGLVSNPTSKKTQQQQQQQQQQHGTQRATKGTGASQAFDYSKYTTDGSAGAISDKVQANTSEYHRGGGSNKQGKGSVNPYFASSLGNQQAGPKKAGGTNKPSSSDRRESSSAYERKDKDRSFVYSNK